MVEESLSNYGLFIDDENKIRLIDPERLTDSGELRDECKDFIDSKWREWPLSRSIDTTVFSDVLEFKKLVDNLIEKTEEYSKQVEASRLKVSVIGSMAREWTIDPVAVHRSKEHVEISGKVSRVWTATAAGNYQGEDGRIGSVRMTIGQMIIVESSFFRLRAEYDSLVKTEREQSEKMEQLSLKAYVSSPFRTFIDLCRFRA